MVARATIVIEPNGAKPVNKENSSVFIVMA